MHKDYSRSPEKREGQHFKTSAGLFSWPSKRLDHAEGRATKHAGCIAMSKLLKQKHEDKTPDSLRWMEVRAARMTAWAALIAALSALITALAALL